MHRDITGEMWFWILDYSYGLQSLHGITPPAFRACRDDVNSIKSSVPKFLGNLICDIH